MEHKDCVHDMLQNMRQADIDNPGDPEEESQLDQLCALYLDTMRHHVHGVCSKEVLEGAMLGGRMLWLRVVGLVAGGALEEEFAGVLRDLIAEMGLVLSRAYYAEAGTVAELEALWNL